jgi:hypothetical protein
MKLQTLARSPVEQKPDPFLSRLARHLRGQIRQDSSMPNASSAVFSSLPLLNASRYVGYCMEDTVIVS